MSINRGARLGVTLAVVGVLCGCGASIKETRILQSRDENGQIGYYQLELDGRADLAKTSYRAGLYDAEALDALMSGVSEDGPAPMSSDLQRLRQKAILETAERYYTALAKGERREVRELETRLAVAMRSPYMLSSEDPVLGRYSPKRRFALILSTQASEIEEAIADFAEEKETTDTILTALASQKRQEYVKTSVETESLQSTIQRLRNVRKQLEQLEAPAAGDKAARAQYLQRVNALMRSIATTEVP